MTQVSTWDWKLGCKHDMLICKQHCLVKITFYKAHRIMDVLISPDTLNSCQLRGNVSPLNHVTPTLRPLAQQPESCSWRAVGSCSVQFTDHLPVDRFLRPAHSFACCWLMWPPSCVFYTSNMFMYFGSVVCALTASCIYCFMCWFSFESVW